VVAVILSNRHAGRAPLDIAVLITGCFRDDEKS
jgi:hypothetical protein